MKLERVKVVIEKVGRIWIQAKDTRYNKKVKIQINEFFTKETAKENLGKEIELDCNIEFEANRYGKYDVIMYPVESIEKIKAEKQLEKERAEKENLKNKIFSSLKKWTKTAAAEGEFYVSNFVKENLENLDEEDKEEALELIEKYKKLAENLSFTYYEHLPYYSKYEVGDIVKNENGQYGIVIKSKTYKVSQEDVEDGFYAWGTKYCAECLCKILKEDDSKVIEYKEKQQKKQEIKETEEKEKQERKDFLNAFDKEFSEENEVKFSEEEKEFIQTQKIELTGKEIYISKRKVIVIEEKYIWIVINNTSDDCNWDINFIQSKTAEGYGHRVLKTDERMKMIEKYVKIKSPLIND